MELHTEIFRGASFVKNVNQKSNLNINIVVYLKKIINKKNTIEKLSSGLSGIAGEYFVAAELSRRGFMASVTLRNNDSIDIHASNLSNNKIFAIQVKTRQINGRSWPLNIKAETKSSKTFYYVFVSLKGLQERPEYFIVPSEIVADRAKESHQLWLKTPGKKGQAHNDSAMRIFEDRVGEFLEKWDLLQ